MTRRVFGAALLALLVGTPAMAQTRLTFLDGGGAARGASGSPGTFDARAIGVEFHLAGSGWIGTEVGIVSGTGRGFGAEDSILLVPVNLYGYLGTSTRVRPFLTIGYTSVDILGAGMNLGAGLDLSVWKRVALRLDVRVVEVFDKSGTDQFAMWRVGAVIGLGRQ